MARQYPHQLVVGHVAERPLGNSGEADLDGNVGEDRELKAGVAGVYNRASYEPEKRTPLDRWAAHALVEGRESNVAPLKRA